MMNVPLTRGTTKAKIASVPTNVTDTKSRLFFLILILPSTVEHQLTGAPG
jgi:hypothetical protein